MTLRPNGDIVFVYIEVQPVLTTAALYDHEPVAGISGIEIHRSKLWPPIIRNDKSSLNIASVNATNDDIFYN